MLDQNTELLLLLDVNHQEKVINQNILSILGTLLNLLFSTKFEVMNSDDGR